MRHAQLFALCLAVCALACDSDDPDRATVDLVDQTRDPSIATDSGEAPSVSRPGDGGSSDRVPRNEVISNGKPGQMDASIPVEDATVPPDAARGPYDCDTNNDCVIQNVGNCCGYYPRCANVNAIFTPPDCSGGQAGVCGFPAIDSCTCRENTCRSLQAGVEL